MPAKNELRVFISSTFRDLNDERDYLVKKIFPAVRAACREKGVTFTEVDLRWGVTEDDVTSGRVIRTCLEEIERTRPYFIGITGERYGFVPEEAELSRDPEFITRFPWIRQAIKEGASLTELEFRFGALNNFIDEEGRTRSSFYFREREPPYGGTPEDHERLSKLETLVRERGFRVFEYDDAAMLGEQVRTELLAMLARDFGEVKPLTPLEEERTKHEAFAQSRRHTYLPKQEYLDTLNRFVATEGEPMVVYGRSGSGKSSLVAHWAEVYRKANPDLPIIEHYVGVGAGATDHQTVMRHIITEIKERFKRTEDIPQSVNELERQLTNWLGYTMGAPLVIILDGVNQLTGLAAKLKWLPKTWPKNIRLIISATTEETRDDLVGRGWQLMEIDPLMVGERRTIVVDFLREYGKALSEVQIDRIAHDPKCAHPLFLRTLLEELRIFGSYERLGDRVLRCLSTLDTDGLFQLVLERMEEDFGAPSIREVMSALWAARTGLSEGELVELTKRSRLEISMSTISLDYHLLRREGLLSFFHDFLRRAVEKRYQLFDVTAKAEHALLAEFFTRATQQHIETETLYSFPIRVAREATHQLRAAEHFAQLADLLALIPVFKALWREDRDAFLEMWRELAQKGEDCGERYLAQLATLRKQEAPRFTDALSSIAAFFSIRGKLDEALLLAKEMLERAERSQNLRELTNAHRTLGSMYLRIEDEPNASEHYERAFEYAKVIGDDHIMGGSLCNIGITYDMRGDREGAIDHYQQALTILERIGAKQWMSNILGNMGGSYEELGKFDEARACYERQLALAESFGGRREISMAMAGLAYLDLSFGEFEKAIAQMEAAAAIDEAIGDAQYQFIHHGNVGLAAYELHDYERALNAFGPALEAHRKVGFKWGMTHWLKGIADILYELGTSNATPPDYVLPYLEVAAGSNWPEQARNAARHYAIESLAVSNELGKRDTMFTSRVLLAELDRDEGRKVAALEQLHGLLNELEDPAMKAETHYRLWKMAGDPEHKAMSQEMFETLFKEKPLFAYSSRINALRAL